MAIDEQFLGQMLEATKLLQSSGPAAATAVIQRALQGTSGATAPWASKASTEGSPSMLQPCHSRNLFLRRGGENATSARQTVDDVDGDADVALETKGRFLTASCTNRAGTRAYKVYFPGRSNGRTLPLIVMLHGCKQNPDDFAAGTRMNAMADENGCLVVYPAQTHAANGSNCWNWFKAEDQQRDHGEPSILADITREAIRKYPVDPSRVYIAGLSAGGAMAAIMGANYPELYAAVGIHSGLPVGAAHDLPSALAAMKNGASMKAPRKARRKPMPVIVFHGDRDATVHPRNGEQALEQCIPQGEPAITVEEGKVPHGHAYTRILRHDRSGKVIAEQWIVHGAGHAWSGGSRNGSYTDPTGPNAAQEMLRFFYTQARRG